MKSQLLLGGIIAGAMASWVEVVSVMTRGTPKTPMAFFNRLLVVIGTIVVAALYSNIDPRYKAISLVVGAALLVCDAVWVGYFSWTKPENLLYGAETHFEKWRMGEFRSGMGATPPLGGGLEPTQDRIVTDH
jgi:hypothetical protein